MLSARVGFGFWRTLNENAAPKQFCFFRADGKWPIARLLRGRRGVQSRSIFPCSRAVGRMVDCFGTPRARCLKGIDSIGRRNVPFAARKPAGLRRVVGFRPVDSRTSRADRDRPCGGYVGTGRRQVLRRRRARRFAAAGSAVQRRRANRARNAGPVAKRICAQARQDGLPK